MALLELIAAQSVQMSVQQTQHNLTPLHHNRFNQSVQINVQQTQHNLTPLLHMRFNHQRAPRSQTSSQHCPQGKARRRKSSGTPQMSLITNPMINKTGRMYRAIKQRERQLTTRHPVAPRAPGPERREHVAPSVQGPERRKHVKRAPKHPDCLAGQAHLSEENRLRHHTPGRYPSS